MVSIYKLENLSFLNKFKQIQNLSYKLNKLYPNNKEILLVMTKLFIHKQKFLKAKEIF